MIEVKGTRQTEAEGPATSDRYAFADAQGLSRIPMLFGLLITGIVAYLKLALTPAQAAQPTDPPTPEPEQEFAIQPAASSAPEQLDNYRKKAGVADAPHHLTPPPPLDPDSHISNVIGFPGPRFALADSSVIDFSGPGPASVTGGAGQNGTPKTPSAIVPPARDDLPPDEPPPAPGPAQSPGEDRRNRAPESSGPVRLNNVVAGTAVLIGLSELLTNIVDADGDTLEVGNVRASTGSIGRSGDAWVYSSHAQTPASDVVITYQVSDGTTTVTHTAVFKLDRGGDLVGTEQLDHLVGMDLADRIDARGGNDLIDARGGNDIVFGGDGDDLIVAGAGHDFVYGGAGNDRIFGGAGNDMLAGGDGDDWIFGGDGNDTILGERGNDRLFGGAGDDLLSGGDGDDMLSDGEGADTLLGEAGDDIIVAAADATPDVFDGGVGTDTLDLSVATGSLVVDLEEQSAAGDEIGENTATGFETVIGGSGDDTISGDAGSETLHGGAGDDVLEGRDGDDEIHDGAGSDTVEGGGGNDRVVVALDAEDDSFSGGEGTDKLDLSATTVGVTVNLVTGQVSSVEIGNDTITGFEEVLGGAGNDMFHVGDQAVVLTGGAGEDTFSFGLPLTQVMDRPQVIHDILDFLVGDRILVAEYEFSRTGRNGEENRFDYYFQGEDTEHDQSGLRLRIRYEFEGNEEKTLLEFDYDGDQNFDLVIAIQGQHQPYLYEHAVI